MPANTDLPMLVLLRKQGEDWFTDRNLRASDFDGLGETNNPDWKTVAFDKKSNGYVVPNGSIGFRWGEDGKVEPAFEKIRRRRPDRNLARPASKTATMSLRGLPTSPEGEPICSSAMCR